MNTINININVNNNVDLRFGIFNYFNRILEYIMGGDNVLFLFLLIIIIYTNLNYENKEITLRVFHHDFLYYSYMKLDLF